MLKAIGFNFLKACTFLDIGFKYQRVCPYTACCGNKRDITLLMREAVTGAAAIKLTLTHRTKPEVATTAVVRLYLPPFPPPPLPPPPRWGSAG